MSLSPDPSAQEVPAMALLLTEMGATEEDIEEEGADIACWGPTGSGKRA